MIVVVAIVRSTTLAVPIFPEVNALLNAGDRVAAVTFDDLQFNRVRIPSVRISAGVQWPTIGARTLGPSFTASSWKLRRELKRWKNISLDDSDAINRKDLPQVQAPWSNAFRQYPQLAEIRMIVEVDR